MKKNRFAFILMAIAAMTITAQVAFCSPVPSDKDLEPVQPVPAAPAPRLERIEDWFRGVFARITGRCDVADDQIALTNIKCLEARRASLNARRGSSAGDRELIYRMLVFSRNKDESASAVATVDAWTNPSQELAAIESWGDQKYLYRYLAHLKLQESPRLITGRAPLTTPRTLTSSAQFAETMISVEAGAENAKQNSAAPSEFYSETSPVTTRAKADLSAHVKLDAVLFDQREVGFLIENNGGVLDFVFDPNGLDLQALGNSRVADKAVVADLPGPMHTERERLIELGVSNGRIFNLLTGGGTRRSGLVVVTPDGRAFPFHVEDIDPTAWGSASRAHLNLLHSSQDLVAFLQIAKQERLSVFMEMLLGEEIGGELGMTPIKNLALSRSARLLVWKSQRDGRPSILYLKDGSGKNRAVWAAHRLGYKWIVNLDAYYLDGARYFAPQPNGRTAVTFGTRLEKPGDKPWSRLILRD